MERNIYTLIFIFVGLFTWGQNLDGLLYGSAQPSDTSSAQTYKTLETCNQIVPVPDDLTNGSYLGGNTGNRVAVDVSVDPETTMTINQIKVSLAKAGDITYAHFKFHTDNEGLPGEELFDVNDTEIIAEDTLTYINVELGYLRTFTIQLNTPIVLNGAEHSKYWMEVVSDARAWGANPYAEQGIGHGLAMRGNNFDWFELIGIESMYEIYANCDGEGGAGCSQGNESNGFEDGYSFASSNSYLLADDFIVQEGTTFSVQQVKMNVLTTQESIEDVTLHFRSDNSGVPGEILNTVASIVPTSQIELGTAFDMFTVFEITLDLPSAIELTTGTYWLQPSGNATSSDWEVTSAGTLGYESHLSNDGGVTWQTINYDNVFQILGECNSLGVDDESKSDFSYYPNPVKNTLTINAEKNVKSIDIYNMTGQTVFNQKLISNNSTFNISSLTAGIYMVKVVLENGQVETFKIIKK